MTARRPKNSDRTSEYHRLRTQLREQYPGMTFVCFTHDADETGKDHVWCASVSRGVTYDSKKGIFRMRRMRGAFDFSVVAKSRLAATKRAMEEIPKRMYRKG
jgi:hypothetical protein